MANAMKPFRAPETFGLAGLMEAEARIYHEVLFDLTGVGRVSDLFSARLKRSIPDDLSFRATLLFGVLDSLKSVATGNPVRVECGLDSEKIGISISLTLPPAHRIQVAGLKERVLAGKGSERIELMIHDLLNFSDRVCFKSQPSTGLIEICILSLRSSAPVERHMRERGSFEVFVLGEEIAQPPVVAEYTALGDVDYRKLLKSSRDSGAVATPPSGEVLLHEARDSAAMLDAIRARKLKLEESSDLSDKIKVSGSDEQTAEEVIQVAGSDEETAEEPIRLKGSDEETAEEPIRLKGSKEESDDQVIKVSGTTQKMDSDQTEIRVEGSASPAHSEQKIVFAADKRTDQGQDKSVRVIQSAPQGDDQGAEDGLDAELGAASGSEGGEGDEGLEDQDDQKIVIKASKKKKRKSKGLFDRFLSMFTPEEEVKAGKSVQAEDAEDQESDSEDDLDDESQSDEAAESSEDGEGDDSAEIEVQAGLRDIKSAAGDLEKEFENGSISQLIERVEKEAPQIRAEVKNAKAEKWLEGLGSDLLAERAKLAAMSKKLTQMVRQKELEFKNRENTLLGSVRSKDEALRTKTLQLMRMKDQVAKLQMTVERSKGATAGNEETATKMKLTQTQRLLQSARSETDAANNKVLEMRAAVEQLIEQRKQMISPAAHAELQKKADRLAKQVEDLRRAAAAAKSEKPDAA